MKGLMELLKQNKIAKFVLPSLASFLILLITLFAWMSGIYGWFSANRTTSSSGMKVEVVGAPALVISDNSTTIQNMTMAKYFVSFPADSNSYRPARSTFGDFSTCTTGLCTVNNTGSVDVVSGLQKEGSENLAYSDATNGNGALYYRDVIVYIASQNSPLTNHTLSATISRAVSGGQPITSGSLMGLSIDFYVSTVSASNYKGTLNVAGQNPDNVLDENDDVSDLTTINLLNDVVPLNTSGYLTIIMRVYFDGELLDKDDTDKAYINTATLDFSL